MRIAITGSNGLLGSSLKRLAMASEYYVVSINRDDIYPRLGFDQIYTYIKSLKCDFLIHCAANTNVEFCEVNKTDCFKDNTLLTEVIVRACNLLNVKFVFISSTGIYGTGQSEPYIEYDNIKPTTLHHRSKYLSEKLVNQIAHNSLVIRTGWLFGGDIDSPKNFIANRIKEAKKSDGILYSDPNQIGNPTYVLDVSKRILLLLKDNVSGTFNCVNTGAATRYDYVSEIIKNSPINVAVQAATSTFKRVAPVSFNESALNFKMTELGYENLPFWQDSLKKYMDEMNNE